MRLSAKKVVMDSVCFFGVFFQGIFLCINKILLTQLPGKIQEQKCVFLVIQSHVSSPVHRKKTVMVVGIICLMCVLFGLWDNKFGFLVLLLDIIEVHHDAF